MINYHRVWPTPKPSLLLRASAALGSPSTTTTPHHNGVNQNARDQTHAMLQQDETPPTIPEINMKAAVNAEADHDPWKRDDSGEDATVIEGSTGFCVVDDDTAIYYHVRDHANQLSAQHHRQSPHVAANSNELPGPAFQATTEENNRLAVESTATEEVPYIEAEKAAAEGHTLINAEEKSAALQQARIGAENWTAAKELTDITSEKKTAGQHVTTIATEADDARFAVGEAANIKKVKLAYDKEVYAEKANFNPTSSLVAYGSSTLNTIPEYEVLAHPKNDRLSVVAENHDELLPVSMGDVHEHYAESQRKRRRFTAMNRLIPGLNKVLIHKRRRIEMEASNADLEQIEIRKQQLNRIARLQETYQLHFASDRLADPLLTTEGALEYWDTVITARAKELEDQAKDPWQMQTNKRRGSSRRQVPNDGCHLHVVE